MNSSVSIVIPTYNEKQNLVQLVERIHNTMKQASLDYECVVVDDNSPDGTYQLALQLSKNFPLQAFLRTEESGLSSAMLYGFSKAKKEIVGFIDADLQHPPELIPKLVQAISEKGYLLAVGSRLVEGGGVEEWPIRRRFLSWFGRMLAFPLTPVKDTMSGFFFLRPEILKGVSLNTIGYKLGLEIIVKGKHHKKIREIPYMFSNRFVGESKLNAKIHLAYLCQLVMLYFYKLKKS